MEMIAVVDYGMGNLRSVTNALEEIGRPGELIDDPEQVQEYDRVVLPGVGAFSQAIAHLRQSGMAAALEDHVKAGKPLLGVCLGMQLICRSSTEGGINEGLGWIDAEVVRFPSGAALKVPHMGWNSLELRTDHPLFKEIESEADVYFVHSYHVPDSDQSHVLAATDYGLQFAAIIGRGSVIGMQFHPEKSQRTGLKLLENFFAWHA